MMPDLEQCHRAVRSRDRRFDGWIYPAVTSTRTYPTGIKISDRQMRQLPITRDSWHGEWNYCLHPTRNTPEPD